MPLISILMPVFNSEQYLDDAILSMLNQTYSNFELIIINDGSKDRSLEIIKKYSEKDKRIIYFTRENKGLVYTLNEGISNSKGKYIIRMDSDDISLPDRIEKQVTFMESNLDIGVCGTNVEVFGPNLKTTKRSKKVEHEYLKAQLLFSPCFAHPSVIIRKSVLLNNNLFYDETFKNIEDYELWTRLSEITKFSNIREVLLKYRVVETSVTRIANKDKEQRKKSSLKIFNNFLQNLNLNNNAKEDDIHFKMSSNTWLEADQSIQLKEVALYFDKLISANKRVKMFNTLYLYRVLGKRWVFLGYYQKDVRIIFSKFFYYGLLDLILNRTSY